MAKTNGKHLVIVESPAKAKTINKYLGDDYVVKASMGHVRDLPEKSAGKGDVGVDLTTFEPRYELITRNKKDKLVTELKKLAKQSDQVYLATDLDREGRGHRLAPQGGAGHPRRAGPPGHLQRHHQEPRSRRRSATRPTSTWTG